MFNEGGKLTANIGARPRPYPETALSYIPDDVWNESCSAPQCGQNANILAGGGGASAVFAKPSWQSPTLWPSLNIPNDGSRDVPDISLTAAGHDPYLCFVYSDRAATALPILRLWHVCGCSFIRGSHGSGTRNRVQLASGKASQGQADYVLYSLAGNQTYSQCNGSNLRPFCWQSVRVQRRNRGQQRCSRGKRLWRSQPTIQPAEFCSTT